MPSLLTYLKRKQEDPNRFFALAPTLMAWSAAFTQGVAGI